MKCESISTLDKEIARRKEELSALQRELSRMTAENIADAYGIILGKTIVEVTIRGKARRVLIAPLDKQLLIQTPGFYLVGNVFKLDGRLGKQLYFVRTTSKIKIVGVKDD